jgi:hypothetical protein
MGLEVWLRLERPDINHGAEVAMPMVSKISRRMTGQ